MEIRALRSEDLDGLLGLYAQLNEADAPLPERAEVEATWAEALGQPRSRYFGGFAQEALVATCLITVVPNLTRGCRPYGLIENVVTDAAQRRRGWGRALLQHALDHAWSQRCYKVMLMTSRKDAATLRFYEQAGFDPQDKRAFVARAPY